MYFDAINLLIKLWHQSKLCNSQVCLMLDGVIEFSTIRTITLLMQSSKLVQFREGERSREEGMIVELQVRKVFG